MRNVVLLLLLWLCVDPLWGQSSLAPPDVASVSIRARTEEELTLEWNKVNNVSYVLRYINGIEIPITVSMNGTVVMHTVSSLSPGTKYTFTLYTVLKGMRSTGFQLTAVTTPSNVVSVSVKARSEITITFEWYKVGNNNAYVYILRQSNSKETHTPMYWGGTVATHTVSSLSPGTKYNFTLYTVFGGERSRGYNFSAVTMPVNVHRVNVTHQYENQLVLSWEKVNSSTAGYILRQNNMNETLVTELDEGSVVTYTVTSLSPGTKYIFTLYTVFEGVRSRGLNFSSATASLIVTGLRCERLFASGLVLVWDAPGGMWNGVEVQVKGRSPQYSNRTRLEIHDLQPARWYNVTLKLCSGDVRSAPVAISCQTESRDPGIHLLSIINRGVLFTVEAVEGLPSERVIGGTVSAVLFITFLVCIGVCVNCRPCSQQKNTEMSTNLECVYNSPVHTKTQASVLNNFTPGSSKQKRVNTVQHNPYRSPIRHLPRHLNIEEGQLNVVSETAIG